MDVGAAAWSLETLSLESRNSLVDLPSTPLSVVVLLATAPATAAVVAAAAAVVLTVEDSVTFPVVLVVGEVKVSVFRGVERSVTSCTRPVVAGTVSNSDSKKAARLPVVWGSRERVSTSSERLGSETGSVEASAIVIVGETSSYRRSLLPPSSFQPSQPKTGRSNNGK